MIIWDVITEKMFSLRNIHPKIKAALRVGMQIFIYETMMVFLKKSKDLFSDSIFVIPYPIC